MELLLVFAGLAGLWFGTKLAIQGAKELALRLNVSRTFIGLAVLAIGTDLPEIFVSISGTLKSLGGEDSSGVIAGNAIGSCIAQISIILGVASLFNPHALEHNKWRDGTALLLSLLILIACAIDGVITRVEGLLLLLSYTGYFIFLMRQPGIAVVTEKKSGPSYKIVVNLIAGLAVLLFASHIVVENSMKLAEEWNVSQTFIGIILIGLGTSLPELAVALGAAFRKENGLSVGTLVGSNIFDALLPVGISSVVRPLTIHPEMITIDLPVLLGLSTLALVFLIQGFNRTKAMVLIASYFLYVVASIIWKTA